MSNAFYPEAPRSRVLDTSRYIHCLCAIPSRRKTWRKYQTKQNSANNQQHYATLQSNTRYAPKEAPLDTYDLAKVYTQQQFGCILQRYEDNQKEDVA